MLSLSCDLWLMERNAFRQFLTIAPVSQQAQQPAVELAAEIREGSGSNKQARSIAVVPVIGAMEARPTPFGRWLGMTSYKWIGDTVAKYGADDSVSHIVLDMATPGGMVYGCQECAALIREVTQRKPVIAVVNPMAASGGYWLAAAASRIVITPSGDSGSVGVISEHVDLSKSMENEGVKITVIRSTNSPYKQENNDAEPLSDAARANMQLRADEIYQRFVSDIALYRGKSVEHVNEHFGKGRLVDANRSVSTGMADRIGTMDDLLTRIMEGRVRLGGAGVADVWDAPTKHEQRRERIAAFETAATIADESVEVQ